MPERGKHAASKTRPNPEDIARLATKALAAKADPVRAKGVERYFKAYETVKSYGVASPDVRALAADLYSAVKGTWTFEDAVELCDILFARRELEAKGVGGLILARFKKVFPRSLAAKVKSWLADDLLDNWASVDVFCTDAMGALLAAYPDLADTIAGWIRHPNRWVKRAALVSFIKPAKRPAFLPAIYDVSRAAFPVDDDLIHKANGWLLREAGKTDPLRLERFLLAHGPAIPRTTLRYAIERFPEAKRKALLAKTKR
jgi:3-methyladenine DNA glycosylase AlkD